MPQLQVVGEDGDDTGALIPRDHNQQASGAQLTTVAGAEGSRAHSLLGGSVIKLPFPDVLKGERQELEASPAVELVLELHPENGKKRVSFHKNFGTLKKDAPTLFLKPLVAHEADLACFQPVMPRACPQQGAHRHQWLICPVPALSYQRENVCMPNSAESWVQTPSAGSEPLTVMEKSPLAPPLAGACVDLQRKRPTWSGVSSCEEPWQGPLFSCLYLSSQGRRRSKGCE